MFRNRLRYTRHKLSILGENVNQHRSVASTAITNRNDELPSIPTESIASPTITSPKATHIPETTTSYHWDTVAPRSAQLAQAERFFLAHPPSLLFSASKFRTVNLTSVPEVAFLGRSNVGKSSLLNALLGRKICFTSSKPGRTRSMNAFAVGGEDGVGNPGRLTVLDMPGYGKGSREEWGTEIMKYLVGRKQLRRAFLLIDALHGIKTSDEQLLALMRQNAIPHQIILSKVDRILLPGSKSPSEAKLDRNAIQLRQIVESMREKIQPKVNDGPAALGEILTCSAEKSLERGRKLGINSVRWAVLAATGLGQKKGDFVESEFTSDRSKDTLKLKPEVHASSGLP